MKEIKKMEIKNIRVLTTQQLSEAYETEPDVLYKNFNNNKKRYKEGKHYMLLQGEELREAKANGNFYGLQMNANKFYLWTEKGAFLHAKSLNTDVAWDVYDRLVETYFDESKEGLYQASFKEVVEAIPCIATDLRVNEISRLSMYKNLCTDFGVPSGFLPDYVQGGDREKKPVTELLKEVGSPYGAVKFNKLLLEAGILEERSRKSSSSKTGVKTYKSLTQEGIEYGENQINPKNEKETQPYYYVDTFQKLYDLIMDLEVA